MDNNGLLMLDDNDHWIIMVDNDGWMMLDENYQQVTIVDNDGKDNVG